MNTVFRSILFVLVFLVEIAVFGQSSTIYPFEYISPMPGVERVKPANNISFTMKGQNQTPKTNDFHILVTGSKSGVIHGEKKLAADGKTFIFKPEQPFQYGEIVEVHINLFKDNLTVDYSFFVSNTSKEYQC